MEDGDGVKPLIVSKDTGTASLKTWSSGGQWERPTFNDGHSAAETETEGSENSL